MALPAGALSTEDLVRIDEAGTARLGGTRVTLDSLVYSFNQGCTAEEIQAQYPSLSLAQVYGGITYYLWHRQEVDDYLAERERAAEQVRAENEVRFSPAGLRERLAARRQ
ncbi:MAG TPA: DUF433 domain-containing protein [Armatimonadota bacterium]|jgi:uncharacterized protein (DUF433 family)